MVSSTIFSCTSRAAHPFAELTRLSTFSKYVAKSRFVKFYHAASRSLSVSNILYSCIRSRAPKSLPKPFFKECCPGGLLSINLCRSLTVVVENVSENLESLSFVKISWKRYKSFFLFRYLYLGTPEPCSAKMKEHWRSILQLQRFIWGN